MGPFVAVVAGGVALFSSACATVDTREPAPQRRELGPPAATSSRGTWLTAPELFREPPSGDAGRADCILDRGGCGRVAAIPPCSGALASETVGRLLETAGEHEGREVVVRGDLEVRGRSTLLLREACSNSRSGSVYATEGERRLGLWDDRAPQAFFCGGDDSEVCCGIAALEQGTLGPRPSVLVRGTLTLNEPGPGASGKPRDARWFLARPEICALGGEGTPASSSDCVVEGRRYGRDEAFESGGRRCGCYEGAVACVDAATACFHSGRWYPDRRSIPTSDCHSRQCRSGAWVPRGMPCMEPPSWHDMMKTVRGGARSRALFEEAEKTLGGCATRQSPSWSEAQATVVGILRARRGDRAGARAAFELALVRHGQQSVPPELMTPEVTRAIDLARACGKEVRAKIREVIENAVGSHVATDAQGAARALRELSDGAARTCGPGVAAEASAHAAIVLGAGLNDLQGSRAALERAVTLDPRVRMDEKLTPTAVRDLFEEIQIRAERCELAFVPL